MLLLRGKDVYSFLLSLNTDDIKQLLTQLEEHLAAYSSEQSNKQAIATTTTTTTDNITTNLDQPKRISVNSKYTTALLMPCADRSLIAVKTVTFPRVDAFSSDEGHTVAPFPPRGCLSIYSGSTGSTLALMNAEEITAFRTALSTMIILAQRAPGSLKSLVVFGAGNVAKWMIILSRRLRTDVSRVSIINRSVSKANGLVGLLRKELVHEFSGTKCILETIPLGERRMVSFAIDNADAILTCTPSLESLFEYADLSTKKPRYIGAIGSHTPEMREIPPEIVQNGLSANTDCQPNDKVFIVVDSKAGCLNTAGELVSENVGPEDVVELGELDRKSHIAKLETENIFFKSVGMALLDFVVGKYIYDNAKSRSLGLNIDNF